MTTENRTVDAVLPENIEPVEEVGPVEAPPPEIVPAEAERGAFAFLTVFRHRNYRLFFSGQLASLVGTWITNVTQGWLVYSLTHSPLLLGVVSFAGQVPVFFLAPFGGMISDRLDRRRMLIVTQILAMLQSATLAALTLTGVIRVWHIVALALFQGLVNAFDVPIRQGMTVEMVGRQDLRHAISLNSMMFNLARIVGPSIAGLLIAAVGAGWCFAIDAVSYAAVIVSLIRMRFTPKPAHRQGDALRAVLAGFRYVWGEREIRASLFLIAVCSAFGASYLALLPAFARDVLHQGSEGLGFLYGAVGGGALLGAYALARVPDRHLFATPVVAALSFGIMLVLFSQSHWYWLSLILVAPTAFSLMLLGGSTNTIIQLVARDDMRGRVVAFYAMGFMGMMPWGSLALGAIAERLGTNWAVTVGGCVCIAAAIGAFYDRRGESWKLA
ncbi:MAG TPA: MFS transporter [Rhizomicrobium sp.]|nr:MFS transporter [Rhizomicrobium sp.]